MVSHIMPYVTFEMSCYDLIMALPENPVTVMVKIAIVGLRDPNAKAFTS